MSVFICRGSGEVANNPDFNSKEIMVVIKEASYAKARETITNPQKLERSIDTPNGKQVISVTTDNALPATWLKRNSHQITPPMVRRGEEVIVWQLGTTDTYFWEDAGTRDLKRLETVIYAWSADAGNAIAADLSNCYYFEISSHNGTVTFATSMANNEKASYTIQINGADGNFLLTDQFKNFFLLNSLERLFTFKNSDESFISVDKKVINLYAESAINAEAETINLKASTVNITAPTTNVSENLNVGGSLKVGGTTTLGGSLKAGSIEATSVKVNGRNVRLE